MMRVSQKKRCISGIAAVAAVSSVLLGAASARAEDVELSDAEYTRIDLHGMVMYRGVRDPNDDFTSYKDLGVWFRFALTRLYHEDWFGIDLLVRAGAALKYGPVFDGASDFALAGAPSRWKGTLPGSIVLGVGIGIGPPRGRQSVLLYPVTFARLTLLPKKTTRFFATFRFTPITNDTAWVRSYDLEIAGGHSLWYAGLRGRIDTVTVESPLYDLPPMYSGGPFFGLAFR